LRLDLGNFAGRLSGCRPQHLAYWNFSAKKHFESTEVA
jgi:hypothetical protein